MLTTTNLKHIICSLFEVHADDAGVQRVITPLEYTGASDKIVVRVRPLQGGYQIDENGDAALLAAINGGDLESDILARWAEELKEISPARFGEDETISAFTNDERLISPYIFRVAEAAQQLYTLATARPERQANDFKDRIKSLVRAVALELQLPIETDVQLPIVGAMKADAVLGLTNPLIIIAATSATRLLEAELIYMQYRAEKKPGHIFAVAESQTAVGKKQFERASYYTDKTLIYNSSAFRQLLTQESAGTVH